MLTNMYGSKSFFDLKVNKFNDTLKLLRVIRIIDISRRVDFTSFFIVVEEILNKCKENFFYKIAT